jgi:hypothetical protein
MSTFNYPNTSAYAATPQTTWYLGRYVDRPVPPDSTDVAVQLDPKYTYRPDTFSQDQYGTPAYFWVFMRRNLDVIRQVTWDFVGGIQIYVPTLQRLKDLGY